MDKITPKEMADAIHIHYRKMLAVLAAGHIAAKKSKGDKGRWVVLTSDFAAFVKQNDAKLDKLRKKYVALFRHGFTVARLTERTPEDFTKAGIIYHDAKGFAEWTIYDYVMEAGKATICEVYGNGNSTRCG